MKTLKMDRDRHYAVADFFRFFKGNNAKIYDFFETLVIYAAYCTT